MDYVKNEVKMRLESILNRIDDSGVQEGCIIDEEVALIHDDLLQHIYVELEEMISDIDLVGIDEDDDFVKDPRKILQAKEYLITKGYDIYGFELFPTYPVIFDQAELIHVNYLKLCGYHLHEFGEE